MLEIVELLKPFEEFLNAQLTRGEAAHTFFFHIFRFAHRYLPTYIDYCLFGLIAIPIFHLVVRRYRVTYLIIASFTMIAALYGVLVASGMLMFPLLIHGLVLRWQVRSMTDQAFRRRAITSLTVFITLFYALLLVRESYQWNLSSLSWQGGVMYAGLQFCGVAYMLPKLIHYAVDGLQGKIHQAKTTHVALYMIFFPTLRWGPIERFQNFNGDIENMQTNSVKLSDVGIGLFRILLGCAKMAVYAFYLLQFFIISSTLAGIDTMSWWRLYWTQFLAVVGVWLSFGGYSDVAIGYSRLMGFKIMENFRRPFFSSSIAEWWRRWHISLSVWLRDYVYRPTGGSRHHFIRNVSLTFFVCGAWHALTANYIVWGLAQAVGLIVWRYWRRFWARVDQGDSFLPSLKPLVAYMKSHRRLSLGLGIFTTVNFFSVSGIYFVYDFHRANLYFLRMVTLGWYQGG